MNLIPEKSLNTVIRREGDGKFQRSFGGELNIFLTGKQTGGWMTAAVYHAPPDNGPPVHIHHREDELLIVIEGRFSFFADGKWSEGGPGTAVFLPRDQPHAFKNIGDEMGKLYVMANPSGLESFSRNARYPSIARKARIWKRSSASARRMGLSL